MVESQKKKSQISRVLIYFILIFLCIQWAIARWIPVEMIFQGRMNYDLIKDRPENIDAALEVVKETIEREGLEEYVILLGDSVAYGSPGPAETSVSAYLNQQAIREGRSFRVFNLAMPSMQTGDYYTLLLKLKEMGISTDYVIIDLLYAGFVARQPDPPPVFWLGEQLKALDPAAYEQELAAYEEEEGDSSPLISWLVPLKNGIYAHLPVMKYRDYLQAYFLGELRSLRGNVSASEEVLPWTEKPYLKELFKTYEYQRGLSQYPFIMENTNPQISFINRILELERDREMIVFLTPVNMALVGEFIDQEAYEENLERIDQFFQDKPVNYVNYTGQIPEGYFSDHVHYTAEGYAYLAEELWDEIEKWGLN